MLSRSKYSLLPQTSHESTSTSAESDDGLLLREKPRRVTPCIPRKVRRICRSRRPLYFALVLAALLALQLLFNASYVRPPPFVADEQERVFIAANIVDGDLIGGAWGRSVRELVRLLGKERVFVSVYGGPKEVLKEFSRSLDCEHKIVVEEEEPVDLASLPKSVLPTTGEEKIKRIAYLAEVRNRALKPLLEMDKTFEKVLFLNDVYFTPKEALRLLWGTNNIGPKGEAVYKAACAADFVSSWKYYDTFATRDAEGYSIGVPMFPWFTGAGQAISRRDVLSGKGEVRVKSCWGGMVAFDGWYFQQSKPESPRKEQTATNTTTAAVPLTFRSVQPEVFRDASECCLIHADLMATPTSPRHQSLMSSTVTTHRSSTQLSQDDPYDTGIYLNPYIRVSYSARTHSLLPFMRRFERLLTPLSMLINKLAHLPHFNPRRTEVAGQIIKDRRWVRLNPLEDSADPVPKPSASVGEEDSTWQGSGVVASRAFGGSFDSMGFERRSNEKHTQVRTKAWWANEGFWEDYDRVAQRGEYCGVRQLTVMKTGHHRTESEAGGLWDKLVDEVPPLDG